jgi:hypothetical protein
MFGYTAAVRDILIHISVTPHLQSGSSGTGNLTIARYVIDLSICLKRCCGQVTSYLMMGALSPGLKRHSVTLFEGDCFSSRPCRTQGCANVTCIHTSWTGP